MKDKLIAAAWRVGRTFAQTVIGVWLLGLALNPTLADLGAWDKIQVALAAGVVAAAWNVYEALGGRALPRG